MRIGLLLLLVVGCGRTSPEAAAPPARAALPTVTLELAQTAPTPAPTQRATIPPPATATAPQTATPLIAAPGLPLVVMADAVW